MIIYLILFAVIVIYFSSTKSPEEPKAQALRWVLIVSSPIWFILLLQLIGFSSGGIATFACENLSRQTQERFFLFLPFVAPVAIALVVFYMSKQSQKKWASISALLVFAASLQVPFAAAFICPIHP